MRDATTEAERRAALQQFAVRLRDDIRWEEAVLFEVTQTEFSEHELDALGDDILAAIPEVQPAS